MEKSKAKIRKYSLKQIEIAWGSYTGTWCFKYLKNGEKRISETKPPVGEPVTKLERVRYSQVMGFPRFLKVIYG